MPARAVSAEQCPLPRYAGQARRRLLGGQQPPVVRLAAVVALDLDAGGRAGRRRRRRRAARRRRARRSASRGPRRARSSTARSVVVRRRPRRRSARRRTRRRRPALKRPCLSSRAAGATRTGPDARRARRAARCTFSSTPRPGSCSTRQASPACGQRDSTTRDVLLRQLRGALGGQDHVAAVRQHDDLVGGHLVDAGEQLEGARVERRAALDDVRAELLVEAPHAVARRRPRPRRSARSRPPGAPCRPAGEPRGALLLLLVHVGDVEALDRPGAVEHGDRPLRARRCGRGRAASPGPRRPAPSRRCSSSAGRRSRPAPAPPPETTKFVQ